MKALVKYATGDGNMEIRDVPEPSAGYGEVKIEVKAASICGSDLHIFHGDIGIPMRLPIIPGHEFAGVVRELGEGVKSIQVGDRVTGENTRFACGTCRQCVTGNYNLCRHRLATGYAFDGAFAKYVVIPEMRVHKLPDNVDFQSGALTDPSACAYHAVQEITGINEGDVIMITGPGSMGLFSLQYVKANGGMVILVGREKDLKRLELGHKIGADYSLSGGELKKRVLEITRGEGVDIVLECSGAEAAAQLGMEVLRRQGKYTQIGIFGRPIKYDLDQIVYKEISFTGSFSQKYLGWEKALELCSEGKIKVKPLITHTVPLSSWQEAFELFEKGEAIKVIFNMEEKT
jgi:L-iditol 2-dehydrogenase